MSDALSYRDIIDLRAHDVEIGDLNQLATPYPGVAPEISAIAASVREVPTARGPR